MNPASLNLLWTFKKHPKCQKDTLIIDYSWKKSFWQLHGRGGAERARCTCTHHIKTCVLDRKDLNIPSFSSWLGSSCESFRAQHTITLKRTEGREVFVSTLFIFRTLWSLAQVQASTHERSYRRQNCDSTTDTAYLHNKAQLEVTNPA